MSSAPSTSASPVVTPTATPARSTIISYVILAASSAWSLYQLRKGLTPLPYKIFEGDLTTSLPLAQVWYALALVSSVVGIFRFGGRNFYDRLKNAYDTVSWMALAFGFPCLTAQFYFYHNQRVLGNLHLLATVPTLLAWLGGNEVEKNRTTGFLLVGCTLSLALNAVCYANYGQLLGSVLMLAAFSLFRSSRNRLGLPPVDWFHYALVVSNMLFITSLGVPVYPQSFNLKDTPVGFLF